MSSPQSLTSYPPRPYITVVSGLPRSGTSMMQSILQAGGIEPLTDGLRTADENNPKGYFEFERVKALKDGDVAWVGDAVNKSVKVISFLLEFLPPDYEYRIVFMQRKIEEVLASQKKMLVDRGEATNKVSDEQMTQIYEKHLRKVENWLDKQPNLKVLYVQYNGMLKDPLPDLRRIEQFLDGGLQLEEMVKRIDPSLYRQRNKE